MSHTIADEMVDDYIDGVTTGQLCAGCGREPAWCECDEEITAEDRQWVNKAMNEESKLNKIRDYTLHPCTCSHIAADDISEEDGDVIAGCVPCQASDQLRQINEDIDYAIEYLEEIAAGK